MTPKQILLWIGYKVNEIMLFALTQSAPSGTGWITKSKNRRTQ